MRVPNSALIFAGSVGILGGSSCFTVTLRSGDYTRILLAGLVMFVIADIFLIALVIRKAAWGWRLAAALLLVPNYAVIQDWSRLIHCFGRSSP